MPKDNSIKKVLVIGSGPIVIGQAQSLTTQVLRLASLLRKKALKLFLNPNPATIMTDLDMVHYTYIEPLTIDFIEKVIAKERPDSIIAGMGGQ